MKIIKHFFTEAPTIIEMFYMIAGVSLSGSLIFRFFPEKKALECFVTYRGHKGRDEDFDWTATLERQTIFLFSIFIYSIIILLLSLSYGESVAKVGGIILVVLVFIVLFWLEPVKK